MKLLASVALIVAVSWGGILQRFVRPTNSEAAMGRGMKAWEEKKYGEAVESFSQASRISSHPLNVYDLGTAQIAAGQPAEGVRTLSSLLSGSPHAADAHFNRGNAELGQNRLDAAIREYEDALRLRPADAAAKRNLEIALKKKQQSPQDQSRQPKDGQQPDQPRPSVGEKPPQRPEGEQNQLEAILRSIEQQEREELSRMRKAAPQPRKIGW